MSSNQDIFAALREGIDGMRASLKHVSQFEGAQLKALYFIGAMLAEITYRLPEEGNWHED